MKYKKELESNCVLYFCSHMSASGALHFKSSTGSPTPRDTIQIVAIPSSTQDNCYVCSAGFASNVQWSGVSDKPTTLDGYGITDAATKAELDSLAAVVGNANTQLEEIA